MPNNPVQSFISYTSVTHALYFARYFIRQFYLQNGLQIASSLAYATLLSIVPLVTVMFGFFGGLPVLEGVSGSIQEFVFANFVPSFGYTVQKYIQDFSIKASQLTITGSILLLVIAIMLMATIDTAFNRIWCIRTRRNPMARFLVYWAVLTLGPLLVGAGLVSTSYLLSLPIISDVDSALQIKSRFLSWMPFLTTSVAFTLLYIIVPNCYVNRFHALIGGLFSAVMFEFAKYGFGFYVRDMPTYETIYGAIAVIPLFLIWIYVSWVIVLLGAHITFCLSSFQLEGEKAGADRVGWEFRDAFSIIGQLWAAQKDGKTVNIPALKKEGITLPQNQINEIFERLLRKKWVHRTSSGNWILARDLSEVTLFDLQKILHCRLPFEGIENPGDKWERSLQSFFEAHRGEMKNILSVPIGSLMRKED
jgi:membrane protein